MVKKWQITVYSETAPTMTLVQGAKTNGALKKHHEVEPEKVTKLKIKWDPVWGSRPGDDLFQQIRRHSLAQPESKTEFALAMMLREDGASLAQLKAALGAAYLSR